MKEGLDMPKTLGPYHMANNESFEVQRNNNFEVQIVDVGGDDLTFAVESSSLPSISNNVVELQYGNATVKVAGKVEFDDVSVEVKDFIGADIEQVVKDWQKQVYNPEDDSIGLAINYKREAYLYEFAPDGSNERQWTLKGVWPSSIEFGDMSYDDDGAKMISMTLSVDKAIRE